MKRTLAAALALAVLSACALIPVNMRPDASKVEKWVGYVDTVEAFADGFESVAVVECDNWVATKTPLPAWAYPKTGLLDARTCSKMHESAVVVRELIAGVRLVLDAFAANPDDPELEVETARAVKEFRRAAAAELKKLHVESVTRSLTAKPVANLSDAY